MKTLDINECDFKVVYATQTGNAKVIAERLAELASEKALKAHVHCVSEVNVPPFERTETVTEDGKLLISGQSIFIFICSSTGDGDPPDTAQKIVRFLKRFKKQEDDDCTAQLNGVQYAFLCLGDTNYSTFCGGGRQFDSLLNEFGARRILETRYADDAVGLDMVVEPWFLEVLTEISKFKLGEVSSQSARAPTTETPIETLVDRCKINEVNVINQHPDNPRFNAFWKLLTEHTKNSVPAAKNSNVPPIITQFSNWWSLTVTTGESSSTSSATNSKTVSAAAFEKWRMTSAAKLCEVNDRSYYEIWLQREVSAHSQIAGKPGDAVSVAFRNSEVDVDEIIDTLDLRSLADSPLLLTETENSDTCTSNSDYVRLRKTADFQTLVTFLRGERVTLRKFLSKLVNLRAVPTVMLLRYLVSTLTALLDLHADNESDEELSALRTLLNDDSAFREYVLEKRVSLVDFTAIFQRSCKRVLQSNCQMLFAFLVYAPKYVNASPCRFFSIANGDASTRLRVVFNTLRTDDNFPFTVARNGVCTHFLENKVHRANALELVHLNVRFRTVEASKTASAVAKRSDKPRPKQFAFCLPEDDDALSQNTELGGLVLIAIGTGVAPFIGFIERRIAEAATRRNGLLPPPIELFFGVRHSQLADAFCTRILHPLRDQYAQLGGTLHVHVAVSSCDSVAEQQPMWIHGAHVHVQDALRKWWPCVGETLVKHTGHVYVCGDDGSRSLLQSVITLIAELSISTQTNGEKTWHVDVAELQKDGRFRQDCWF